MKKEVAEDEVRHSQMPAHVKAGELEDDEKLQALCENEKLLLDMIRMICYRVETRLAMVLVKKWNDKRARGIVTRLFQSAADIITERDKSILRVRILGSARDSDDIVAAELLEELNRKKAVYPGTNLRMVYELPPNRAKRATSGSNTLH